MTILANQLPKCRYRAKREDGYYCVSCLKNKCGWTACDIGGGQGCLDCNVADKECEYPKNESTRPKWKPTPIPDFGAWSRPWWYPPPGTILKFIIWALFRLQMSPDCQCGNKAQQMNLWGWRGCWKHRQTIKGWLAAAVVKEGMTGTKPSYRSLLWAGTKLAILAWIVRPFRRMIYRKSDPSSRSPDCISSDVAINIKT